MENKELTPSSNKAIVPTLSGEKEIGFEYNPNEDGLWEVTLGGKKATIKQKDLFSLVFYAANTEQVDKLTPVTNTQVTMLVRKHKVKLLSDLKKGEDVIVRCETPVETTVYEGLRGVIGKRKKSSILLPPRLSGGVL